MKTYTKEKLSEVLRKHKLWLGYEDSGERANLRSADLRSADLRYADLRSANLSSANLRSADLRSADLSSANLRYADLRSANLSSATGQYFITQRADGYQFFLVLDEDGRWYIRAGCQYMSIEDYRKHTESYGEESKKAETNLILDFAEAKLNSAIKASEKAA